MVTLLVLFGLILLALLVLSLRNPIIFQMGVRNIRRRPAQTALIVIGLTLSTIIIVSAFGTGDTVNDSVRRQVTNSYGAIDEIISPPLMSMLSSLLNREPGQETPRLDLSALQTTAEDGEGGTENAGGIDLSQALNMLSQGLPVISQEQYLQLHERLTSLPIIDGVAPSIFSPALVRNLSSGASVPIGFILAVDGEFDAQFGLHDTSGRAVRSSDLRPGGGNIFALVARLFTMAKESDIDVSTAALAVLAKAATSSSGLDPASLDPEKLDLTALASQDMSTASVNPFDLLTLKDEADRLLEQVGLEVRHGEIYLNRAGADQLRARPGDIIEVAVSPIPLPFRVKAIVDEGGPAGVLFPVVVMRLDEAQKMLFLQDRVTNILVSNRGNVLARDWDDGAARDQLRVQLMNEDAVKQVAAILRSPEVRLIVDAEIERTNKDPSVISSDLGSDQSLSGLFSSLSGFFRFLVELKQLPEMLDAPDVSQEFRSMLVNPTFRNWLAQLPLPDDQKAALTEQVSQLGDLEVTDMLSKTFAVRATEQASSVFSTIFLLFGIFSIMAGVLLIFMIFVMLAAERKSEMGIARAIGMQRRHLIQMFVSEGLVYDLAAAFLGVFLGLAVSYVMIGTMGGLFNKMSGLSGAFRFEFHVEYSSLVVAYLIGVLLTFVVVTAASWRVSRLNIVAAIRNLPEDEVLEKRLSLLGRIWDVARGPLIALAGLALWNLGGRTFKMSGATLILIGLGFLADWLIEQLSLQSEIRRRIVYSMVGVGLVGIWSITWDKVLGRQTSGWSQDPTLTLVYFGLAGVFILLGCILVVIYNADVLAWVADRLLLQIGVLAPVLKTAIAYPLSSRLRTGLTIAMFAIVITTVTLMAVVIAATDTLITPAEDATAGFEVRASVNAFTPIADIRAEIGKHPDLPANDITAIGRSSTQRVLLWQVGANQDWQTLTFTGLDEGYIDQARQFYSFKLRAPGFDSDAAVWDALRTRDDVAIATADLVTSGESGSKGFRLEKFTLEDAQIPEVMLAMRLGPTVSATHPVQVIGILEQESTVAGTGLQVNERLITKITGQPVVATTYFFNVRDGANAVALADELQKAFVSNGMSASSLSETFAIGQSTTRGFLQLFQGFMALGLLVGIAALGVISSRTVVERRQQVGVLRAIGYRPSMVALSFLLESSVVSLFGILIGTAAGIVLGWGMSTRMFNLVAPNLAFGIPWVRIGLIVLVTYVFSLISTVIPAYQASRIRPAEALRYE